MAFAAMLQRLRASLIKSAGTVVFGMDDGTVSIFGLIFGVAATTTSTQTVVIAGASGAVAAAVSMMAGVYLDAETTNDALAAKRALAQSDLTSQRDAIAAVLPSRLGAAGLTIEQTAALAGAVRDNPAALCALHVALEAGNRRIPGSRLYGCCLPILPPRPSRSCRSYCCRYLRPAWFRVW
jgi:vacuolar iron transporter family protein